MRAKVLVTTSMFASEDRSSLEKLRQAGFDVQLNPYKRKLTREELLDLLPGAIGLIAGLETLDYEVMSRSELKVISRCGVGLSNVDLEAAQKMGIVVCNTPAAGTHAVAELTVACLLNLLRRIPQMNQDLHEGRWTRPMGRQLKGQTVLIIGFGNIGRHLAQLLKPFEVCILVVDPFLDKVDGPFKLMRLEEALPLADIITLHCSGDICVLSEREFQLMKSGIFLLNAARGGLVDERALIRALDQGRIGGVWMDTFVDEPYSGELRKYPQALLTPHAGSYTRECRTQMELQAVANLLEALDRQDVKL